MQFTKSGVATLVGAALTSLSLSSVAADFNEQSYIKGANTKSTPFNVVANKKDQVASKSGMSTQYDAITGKATFQWAAQNQTLPNFSGVAKQDRVSHAAEFYLNQITGQSSAKKLGSASTYISSIHDQGRGASIAKFKQEVNGVEVFNREYNIMMDREHNLVASSGYLAESKAVALASSRVGKGADLFGSASSAVHKAAADQGVKGDAYTLSEGQAKGKYEQFSVSGQASGKSVVGQPRAKKVYFELKGELIPAFYVEIATADMASVESDYYSYVVDAINGEVLFKHNLTNHAADFSYRVYADTDGMNKPWDSPHGNVIPAMSSDQDDSTVYLDAPLVTLSTGPISTGDAWLADDATLTAGNNVVAYVDAIAPDGFSAGDFAAETTSANTFDYKYDVNQSENSMHNRKAAIVNLFYVNNYLHNWFYDHGFDEAAGNAQEDNYERGGIGGDPIRAEVQDNSGYNNANMLTPADGASPRMQMYLWDSKDAINGEDYGITVTSDEDLGLLTSTQRASFGPGQFSVSGKLVRIADGVGESTDGCEAATNGADLAGNIAIIDRGGCAFTQKALNAQAAGAIAVIVANNRDETVPAPMGGSDDAVTIPNLGISQNEGAAIYAAMAGGDVEIEMFNNRPFKASSWDNGIVAHEWGHYISNRLVGNSSGLINNQGRSMGEGWGDFHGMLMLANKADLEMEGNEELQKAYSVTSYVESFYYGIRLHPYSTDFEVNDHVFSDISNNAQVHASGHVWGTMLWDAFAALVNDERHDYDEAESRMMDYLVAGYKMTPIAPTYTEARDAILAAAYANDPEDHKVMLAAFARRGLGLGAVSPSRFSTSHVGAIDSFETELATFVTYDYDFNLDFAGMNTGFCSKDGVLDKGETATVKFSVKNMGSEVLENVNAKLSVISGQDVTIENDGEFTFSSVDLFEESFTGDFEIVLNESGTYEDLVFEVTFPDLDPEIVGSGGQFSTKVHYDFADRAPENGMSTDNFETLTTYNDFTKVILEGGDRAEDIFSLDSTYASFFPIGSQYLLGDNAAFTADVAFETKTMNVGFGDNFSASWYHYFDIETGWDGGVVEVNINNTGWVDVTEVGGQFTSGSGYTATIDERSEASIAGRDAYTGYSGYPGFVETVSFGQALNGNEVKFRFRMSSDSNTSELGWIIDGLTFTNITSSVYSDIVAGDTYDCDNRVPMVQMTRASSTSVNEGQEFTLHVEAHDPNGDDLSYHWEQTAGKAADISGASTDSPTVLAPQVSSSGETLMFSVTISDGTDQVVQSVSVNVADVTTPANVSSSSSSSGSTGLLALLLMPLAWLRRRTK